MRQLPYFAYGSNMSSIELHVYCPSAVCLGRARLSGFRLDFTTFARHRQGGVADIVPCNDSDPQLDYEQRQPGEQTPFPLTPVWGVLWEVPDEELPALHRKEGYSPGSPPEENVYSPVEISVLLHGEKVNHIVPAFAYSVVNKHRHIPPSEAYLHVILEGAREHDLPPDYIMELTRVGRFQPL